MASNAMDRTVRLLGVLVAVIGLWAITGCAGAYYRVFSNWVSLIDDVFILTFTSIVLAFGLFCLAVAFRAWKQLTVSAIKQIVAILAFALWLVLITEFAWVAAEISWLTESSWAALSSLAAILLAAPLYVMSSRWLIARTSVGAQPGQLVPRGLVRLVCYFLWFTSFELIHELAPKEAGSEHVPESPWLWIALLAPILLAVVVYKSVVHFICRHEGKTIHTAA